jgi:putative phosphoesterase
MTHGHHYDVKWDYQRIFYKGLEMEADVILFGHSHVPVHVEEDGILIMNPGSTSHPRGNSNKSYALLEVGKSIHAELISL